MRRVIVLLLIDTFLVPAEREVIAGLFDLRGRHKESLRCPVCVLGRIAGAPACKAVRQIVLGHGFPLVVEREAIGLDVIEEDVVCPSALGEDQDPGGHARVGPEHSAGQRDHGFQLVLVHQELAQLTVRTGRAEQHAIGHDGRRPAAGVQHAQDQREEEQLGFLGLDLAQEARVHVLEI